jgi:hypothetical protein
MRENDPHGNDRSRFYCTCKTQASIYLYCVILIWKGVFRWWSPNFLLLYAILSFNFNRLTALLWNSGSGFFISILCGTNVWYSRILFPWNYSISPPYNYHCLLVFQIYPGGGFVGLKHLFYGTSGLTFLPEVHNHFLPILLPVLPFDDHWSPEWYC